MHGCSTCNMTAMPSTSHTVPLLIACHELFFDAMMEITHAIIINPEVPAHSGLTGHGLRLLRRLLALTLGLLATVAASLLGALCCLSHSLVCPLTLFLGLAARPCVSLLGLYLLLGCLLTDEVLDLYMYPYLRCGTQQ